VNGGGSDMARADGFTLGFLRNRKLALKESEA
jgi:hypothetical protein